MFCRNLRIGPFLARTGSVESWCVASGVVVPTNGDYAAAVHRQTALASRVAVTPSARLEIRSADARPSEICPVRRAVCYD